MVVNEIKKVILFIFCILTVYFTAACGCVSLPEPTPVPPSETQEPLQTPQPTPEPTPTPEPELPFGGNVTVDGFALPSGSVTADGIQLVSLQEFLSALDTQTDGESFLWRGDTCTYSANEDHISVDGEEYALSHKLITYRSELWIPLDSLCDAMKISVFIDDGADTVYCTSAAGQWEIPNGYTVPVFMYHGVTDDTWGIEQLFMSPADMRDSVIWLLDNGYEPIWFSDLWHVQDYEKPVILTFDDGYVDMYDNLLPILQEFDVKATCFIVTNYLSSDPVFLTQAQVTELSASGLVDIQTHTRTHQELANLSADEQKAEMVNSKLDIIKLTGKEPYVICYPCGSYSDTTKAVTRDNFRFGITTENYCYVTGYDPTTIPRYRVNRSGGVNALVYYMNNTKY